MLSRVVSRSVMFCCCYYCCCCSCCCCSCCCCCRFLLGQIWSCQNMLSYVVAEWRQVMLCCFNG